jgi:hypothetical protein
MEAWTRIYDDTNGFQSPPGDIERRLNDLADEPGYSRMMLSILLPVFAQSMTAFIKLEDRRLALKDLLNAMVIHASTGVWPDSAEAAVRVVRGDVTVTLALK